MSKKTYNKAFDSLQKGGTLKTRQDFVETDYVNGVRDASGKLVMRPLTLEEREFLAQYYKEAENVNFNKTEELKTEQKKLRSLIQKHKSYKEIYDEEHPKVVAQRAKVKFLREESNSLFIEDEQRRELFKQDNGRRSDIFNLAKHTGNLVNFDLNEYDRFTSEAMDSADAEIVGLAQMFQLKKERRKS